MSLSQTIFSLVKGMNDILNCRLLKINSSVFSPVAYDTSL